MKERWRESVEEGTYKGRQMWMVEKSERRVWEECRKKKEDR